MNYRHVAKISIGFIVLIFGFVGFMQNVNAAGLAWFAASIVIAILLFRKTRKDEEYMRRYNNRELLGQRLAIGSMWEQREKKRSLSEAEERWPNAISAGSRQKLE